jgi:hypothetical protein
VDRIDLSLVAAHEDGVIAGAGVQAIGAAPSAHVIVASSAPEAAVTAAGENTVLSCAAVNVVVPVARDDAVVTAPGDEVISGASSAQHVVVAVAPVGIVGRGSQDDVRVGRSAPNLGLGSDRQRQEQACGAEKEWCARRTLV